MPTDSTTYPFLSSSRNNSQSSFRIDPFAMDTIDSKARLEFERERQRSHRGHDVRRKHSGLSIKSNHSATTAHKRPSPGLGQGNWRNSKITMDDMEDYDDAMMDADEDPRFHNKENSRPSSRPVSVSLEDLVIRPSVPSSKKLRESVSRTSLSRQASADTLASALANVSLITAQPAASALPPISELHSRSPSSDSDSSVLLSPMLPPSDYDSSTDDDLDDFDLQLDFPNFDEFSSPAVWTVAEAEDGAPQFRANPPSISPASCTPSAFASSSS
ncbi:hypothetical protein FRB90_007953, partial [Tulasnella sp. 427]